MPPMILVIEPDTSSREFLETFLTLEGYQVASAGRADTALQILREENPALVLMETRLPDMNSLEFNDLLKKDRAHAHIPIVALTTQMLPSEENALADAGFSACLFKPVSPAALRIYIGQFIYSDINNNT